jgi:NhaA family Na+:H+ antiporter
MNPLEELIHFLHPWVAFVIMPLFAFLNAGVSLNGADLLTTLQSPISLGVIGGLVIGKPIGIFLTTWLGKKLRILTVPTGVTNTQVVAIGFLAGIGFTMSLFIGGLSFAHPELLDQAKIGILLASALSAVVGSFLLTGALKKS